MDIYEYRKLIQKIYNESVYGNTKGDIYKELSDLRIDNNFIENIKCNQSMRTITFQLNENVTDRDVSSLLSQIKLVIKDFVLKNLSENNDNLKEFLESDLCYDSYKLNNNIIVQL
jgi:uncharacterized membrane protein